VRILFEGLSQCTSTLRFSQGTGELRRSLPEGSGLMKPPQVAPVCSIHYKRTSSPSPSSSSYSYRRFGRSIAAAPPRCSLRELQDAWHCVVAPHEQRVNMRQPASCGAAKYGTLHSLCSVGFTVNKEFSSFLLYRASGALAGLTTIELASMNTT
jgi:hypothetical protein